jgi:thiol-disulfide isomerase/thioredoxin
MMNAVQTVVLILFLLITPVTSQADVLLKDTEGTSTSFSALKGKWVLINYWASWCETCVEEIPELNRFFASHKNDPVVLFAVNYDGLPLFELKKLIRHFNIRYPNLINDPASALQLEDISGVPVTFVFNPKGQLVNTLYGGQTVRSLNRAMQSAKGGKNAHKKE